MLNVLTTDKKYLQKARKIFQKYYKEELTDEQLIEMINNVLNLVLYLKGIKEKYKVELGKKERGKDETINTKRHKGSSRY